MRSRWRLVPIVVLSLMVLVAGCGAPREPVPDDDPVVTSSVSPISAGGVDHSLAFDSSGRAWAWGLGNYGQLGDGAEWDETRVSYVPVQVASAVSFTNVGAGWLYSLALDTNGRAWAWGIGERLGIGENAVAPVRVNVGDGVIFTAISAGSNHALALDADGNAWQSGEEGVLNMVPVTMPPGVSFTAVRGGHGVSLALDVGGNAWEWGGYPEPGSPAPVAMPPGVLFVEISAAGGHRLAVDTNGNAWGWGWNDKGQLGNGSTSSTYVTTPVPVAMPPGVTFTSISASSGRFSLALDVNGRAWAWGAGGFATALGTGDEVDRLTPTRVIMPSGVAFTAISAGWRHSLAVDVGGTVWAWGYNFNGPLGIQGPRQLQPVPIGLMLGSP